MPGFQATFKANLIAWFATAGNGIQDLFAKNLHAENVYADRGMFRELTASSTVSESGTFGRTVTDELCVKDDAGELVCVTGTQLRSLLTGSVLGASSGVDANVSDEEEEEAADTQEDATDQASSGPSTSGPPNADTASSTPLAALEEAEPIKEPLDDTLLVDAPPASDPTKPPPAPAEPASVVEPTNDNPPLRAPSGTATDLT